MFLFPPGAETQVLEGLSFASATVPKSYLSESQTWLTQMVALLGDA